MMTDRELLEAAARAAGIKVGDAADSEARALSGPGLWFHNDARNHPMCRKPSRPGNVSWDPLNDDGDALRLAVKLGLQLDLRDPETHVFGPPSGRIDEYHTAGDPFAATRRAIVRAAAALAPTPDSTPRRD